MFRRIVFTFAFILVPTQPLAEESMNHGRKSRTTAATKPSLQR